MTRFAGLTLVFFLNVLSWPALSQAPPPGLSKAWSSFVNDAQLRYGLASLAVLDGQTGELVFGRNQQVGMATASTLKVITSVSAFHVLGPGFRYHTRIGYTGNIDAAGVLRGDLLIEGGGDPTLGSWRWEETGEAAVLTAWIRDLRAAGIKRIDGRVIGDQRRLGTQTVPDGWQWNDIGNYYGAGAAALNWRENKFDILLEPSRVGGPVGLRGTKPEMSYLKLMNELRTGASGTGDQAYVYLPPYSEVAYLRGTYAIDERERSIRAAVPDPAFEAAFRVHEAIEGAGIPVSADAATSRRLALRGETVGKMTDIISQVQSPSLADIVKEFNDNSINLYGEALVKTIALDKTNYGSTKEGLRLIREFWARKGIDSNSLVMVDGSGLSPDNRITAAAMARVLLDARDQSWFPLFYSSLPEMNGMHMKSGSIRGVRSYAGYHTARNGRQYIFVLIVNNYNGSSTAIRRKMWSVLNFLK